MNAYQVFSPLTGQHTRYETIEEAKAAFIDIVQEIFKNYPTFVNEEFIQPNGDVTWVPTAAFDKIIITLPPKE